jgi:hypothetical protein
VEVHFSTSKRVAEGIDTGPAGSRPQLGVHMKTRRLLVVLAALALLSSCSGVPTKAIHDWAEPNFKQYIALVDQRYTADDTRLNAYKSMASLICDADTADGKQADSIACKCHHAASDSSLKADCLSFIAAYR